MKRTAIAIAGLLVLLLGEFALAQPLPEGRKLHWGDEPVEATSSRRGRICINGLWRFAPAVAGSANAPSGADAWGWIPVPGSWWTGHSMPSVLVRGKADNWKDYNGRQLARAWYQREVTIPAGWAGRRVLLELTRVSTDAEVYVGDKKMGRINWPAGSADITEAVTPGKAATIRLLVVAAATEKEVTVYMGTGADQVHKAPADFQAKGIIGEAFLVSRPGGTHISDVFVQPSVRKKTLTLDVELADVPRAGKVTFVARMLNEKGTEEKRFTETVDVDAADVQKVRLSWAWENPRLWDLQQPHLYTLQLKATGAGLDDDYPQRFGFREFWIEGKSFMLNGTEIRLRPTIAHDERPALGSIAMIDGAIDGFLASGFNFQELWPWDEDQRGSLHFRWLWADRADRKGWLLAGNALSMNRYMYRGRELAFEDPARLAEYEKRMAWFLKRYRNHPSIVIWSTSGNFFGHNQDQNPRFIGRRGWVKDDAWIAKARAGMRGIAAIKKHDPTRPVFTHQGAYVGDVHTVNMYLNLLPLQEREQWLSEWAASGQMPFMPVEFGCPLNVTLTRGRNGGANAGASEPLMTEFCAAYLGRRAYELERPEYRDKLADQQAKKVAGTLKRGWHVINIINAEPAYQQLLGLFNRHTWRSWRTWGITGGMLPWDYGAGWERGTWWSPDKTDMPAFQPGQRGTYHRQVPTALLKYMQPAAMPARPSGKALVANNGPTLAWIAGPAGEFTRKDHSFRAGQTVDKQIVLLNDTRGGVGYQVLWEASLGGEKIAGKMLRGQMEPAQTLKLPISFAVPDELRAAKVDGQIKIWARVGGVAHVDTFEFRAFTDPQFRGPAVSVFDPYGLTSAMLKKLGYRVVDWDGKPTELLVVGRRALSKGHRPPGDIEAFVRAGGRCVLMSQDLEWLEERGFRLSRYLTRRVFPVGRGGAVMAGLDEADLRDWTGNSTLVHPFPKQDWDDGHPYGWRWGSAGTVSSGAVEKPHRTGWTPLLQCEFDLAYSPLMELNLGKGRLTLCMLDLEDHYAQDPAAALLAGNLLDHAAHAKLSPRAGKVVYMGGKAGRDVLASTGVEFESADTVDATADLIVLGADAKVDRAVLMAQVRRHTRVLVLPVHGPTGPLGAKRVRKPLPIAAVPAWAEAAGLGVSDLRWRLDKPAWLMDKGPGRPDLTPLARQEVGQGSIIWCQLDPTAIDAKTNPYLRYTRWRHLRVLSQLLANLGASFQADAWIFAPHGLGLRPIELSDTWRVKLVRTSGEGVSDELSDDARKLAQPDVDASGWAKAAVPGYWSGYHNVDGEAVFRLEVEIPKAWEGKELTLSLGVIDDRDVTFFNGEQVGKTDYTTVKEPWKTSRVYKVPAKLVKAGRAVIAVRIWDQAGWGGIPGGRDKLFLSPGDLPEGMYHPDYRADFEMGDDPFRYYRW